MNFNHIILIKGPTKAWFIRETKYKNDFSDRDASEKKYMVKKIQGEMLAITYRENLLVFEQSAPQNDRKMRTHATYIPTSKNRVITYVEWKNKTYPYQCYHKSTLVAFSVDIFLCYDS